MAGETMDTRYVYPAYTENLAQTTSNFAAGLPEQIMGTYNNWYSGDLAAGPSQNTQQAVGMAQQSNPWVPQVQQAAQGLQGAYQPYIDQAQNMYQQGSTYDPNQLQQYLNPYTQNAAQATMNQSNQNLMENILPGVNSTFAGTGQFGSTRNADFTNRAIQNQQQTLTDALGKLNYGAYQNAQNDYLNWAKQQQQAAAGMAGLGTNEINYANALGSLAGAGANLDQQQFTNLMASGKALEGLQQNAYDKYYTDWMTQQQYPVQAMGGLATAAGNLAKLSQPDIDVTQPEATDAQKIALAIDALSKGLDDTSIQNLLGDWFNFGGK